MNLTTSVDGDVCPGDTVVFTCVTDTGQLQWSGSINAAYHSSNEPVQVVIKSGIFDLQLINVTGMTLVSTATAYNVSMTDDGMNITCTDNFNNPVSSFEMESIVLGQFSSNSKSSIVHYMQHYYHLNLSMCHLNLPVRLLSPSAG